MGAVGTPPAVPEGSKVDVAPIRGAPRGLAVETVPCNAPAASWEKKFVRLLN